MDGIDKLNVSFSNTPVNCKLWCIFKLVLFSFNNHQITNKKARISVQKVLNIIYVEKEEKRP
ncbi:hypothetical protein FQR65_LT00526 [Abscondita terminalis]|nr:hypothetical protein FQR65_LT00526 [Abscondita terminalis]